MTAFFDSVAVTESRAALAAAGAAAAGTTAGTTAGIIQQSHEIMMQSSSFFQTITIRKGVVNGNYFRIFPAAAAAATVISTKRATCTST